MEAATLAIFHLVHDRADHVGPTAAEDATTQEWTDAAGRTAWYLFDFTKSKILDQPEEIHAFIKCQPGTPRRVEMTSAWSGGVAACHAAANSASLSSRP